MSLDIVSFEDRRNASSAFAQKVGNKLIPAPAVVRAHIQRTRKPRIEAVKEYYGNAKPDKFFIKTGIRIGESRFRTLHKYARNGIVKDILKYPPFAAYTVSRSGENNGKVIF